MLRFIARRIALTLPIFLALIALTFFALRLVPGDPIEVRRGERGISPERLAELRHQMGLDQPLWKQFWDYLLQVLQGDFGLSVVTHEPVLKEFLALFPATLELTLCAMLFSIVFGIPAGILAGLKRGSASDYVVTGVAVTGNSMPIFWWGLLLILLFSVNLDLTPVSGRIDLLYYFEPVTGFMLIDSLLSGEEGAFRSALSHLILPTIVLGTIPLAVITRITRSAMLEVLNEDYVRTARAKGLSPARVVGLHALRNALIPVITVIGLQVSTLIAGAVQTETVFSWPGVGKWLIESLGRRDYPALQGGVLLISIVVVGMNLTIDLVYGLINPRIRHGR
jgi:dipeptide transport system permease protein